MCDIIIYKTILQKEFPNLLITTSNNKNSVIDFSINHEVIEYSNTVKCFIGGEFSIFFLTERFEKYAKRNIDNKITKNGKSFIPFWNYRLNQLIRFIGSLFQ